VLIVTTLTGATSVGDEAHGEVVPFCVIDPETGECLPPPPPPPPPPPVDSMFKTATYGPNCTGSTDGSTTYCQTDNSSFTYFRQSSLSATAQTNIATVLGQLYNPTDLTVIPENPPSYTGGSETDVIYQVNGTLPPTTNARTWCNDAVNTLQCDQHYVAFRSNTYAVNNAIACHETGHATGLTHGQEAAPPVSQSDPLLGCMAVPSPYTLGSHNVGQINATY
jgi:hypothetical protein